MTQDELVYVRSFIDDGGGSFRELLPDEDGLYIFEKKKKYQFKVMPSQNYACLTN